MIVLQELINRAMESDRFSIVEDSAGFHLYARFYSMRVHLATVSHEDAKALQKNRLKVVS